MSSKYSYIKKLDSVENNTIKEIKEIIEEDEKKRMKDNITYFVIYAFGATTTLGFNSLIVSIFDKFHWSNTRIIAKTIYVIIMFIITILLAYYLGKSLRL